MFAIGQKVNVQNQANAGVEGVGVVTGIRPGHHRGEFLYAVSFGGEPGQPGVTTLGALPEKALSPADQQQKPTDKKPEDKKPEDKK